MATLRMTEKAAAVAAGVVSWFCAATLALPSFAETYTWNGASGGDWATPGNWLVGGAAATTAPTSADTIEFNSASALTVGGSSALAVTEIANTGAGDVTFSCPVTFAGTYYVTKNGAVKFPGGATATYPDPVMRTAASTDLARTLDGDFTFTADWIATDLGNVNDAPWIIPDGSTVRGQNFSGLQTSHKSILRIDAGGYACFTTTTNGWDRGDLDIDGTLEATKEVIVRTNPTSSSNSSNFGRSGNIGTVKAPRIAKCEHASAVVHIPNLIVGAGGIGSLTRDYIWRFDVDATVTFTEDCEIHGVYRSGYTYDWGIGCNATRTLTFNVLEGKTVTYGTGFSGTACAIRKTGAGTLVMTDTYNGDSGYVKQYANGTSIEEGTVRIAADGQLGTGAVTISSGATLQVAGGVTLSNQVDGEGTLYVEDGATLAIGSRPWYVGSVALASGANVTLTSGVSAGTYGLLTGVSAADAASFTLDGATLSVVGDTLLTSTGTAGAYVWNGASGADWSVAGNWLVDGATPGAAPSSTDTIVFQNASPVTVGGEGTLTVTKIVTLSDDLVTFNCPVAFAGTYLVENAATAPLFAGGATATFADTSLTDMNVPSHTLNGAITFTADWTIPLQPRPFIVAENSTLTGTVLASSGYVSAQPDIRIDAGAVATFNTVEVGGLLVFWLNGGNLVATGDVHLGGVATGRDFGYYGGNVGTVEANGIYKNVTSYGLIYHYITNMVVGAGGFGMYRKDYTIRLQVDTRLTAKDDLAIHQPISGDGPKDGDWGLNLYDHTFTIDTAGHTVTFDSWTAANAGVVVKEGLGEMIMQSRIKQHTGGTVLNGGLTTVKLAGALGYGTATVNDGATLAFADTVVSFAYPIVVNAGATLKNAATVGDTSTLTLNAGATLKPAQNTYFDLSSGTLVLPDSGTVTVDLTDFTIVNGVATPVLGGVSAGDEAKFAALVPAGVSGAFAVSGGVLTYTATAGGSAAADLFWHPDGDLTWSTSVSAWTNAAGSQVAFEPYANATVADAATIALPSDVEANDVTIAADGDVTLNGAGKLGGPGTIVKTGEGTFTFNATGGLDAQTIVVSNGVFKMGDDLTGIALGATADSSPIVVAAGGTLDLNYNASSTTDDARSKVTREKLMIIAGDGCDGKGAIVNDNLPGYRTISQLELSDDASVGGSVRYDVRGSLTGYVRNSASIYGPGKTLTVKNTSAFGIVYSDVTLGELLIADGGVVQMEGSGTYSFDNGIHLAGGTLNFYNGVPGTVPITADSGANVIKTAAGTTTVGGAVTVASGATLTHSSGTTVFNGAINGPMTVSGGTPTFNGAINGTITPSGGTTYIAGGAPASGLTVAGARGSEIVRLRQSGTYTGANISAYSFGIADVADSTVDATFNNSTLNIDNFYLGWGGIASGLVSIGAGTTLNAGKICVGDNGTSTNKAIKSVFSIDGGTVNLTGPNFYIAYNGPHSDFVLNSGTLNIDQATIRLRMNNQQLGGYNTSRFIQNGGTFTYGGTGFTARYEDNNEYGQIILQGGTMNATNSWSIPNYIPLCFRGGDSAGWTLNQKDGTTATWTTALRGDGDVTLNGEATLVGNKEVQGAVGGKWTVGDGFTAGLQGAASLLGGLDVGEGASVTVDIATNRSAVFTARDYGDNPGDANGGNCITNRFNKMFGGTTRGTITHDMTFFFTKYVEAARPFGSDLKYESTYAVGEFYVEDGAAGEWTFTGICDDWVYTWVDGELVLAPAQGKQGTGTKTLAAGWHSFRHVIIDHGGAWGNAQTLGYKDGSGTMSSFANFSPANLKLRPSADMGAPGNANTFHWRHYKGTSADVTASTFKRDDFAWDFCCITNSLQHLQTYTKTDTTWLNTYTVNRYDGWFYVTAENADKTWTFRTQYDDRCALWIDGVDTGLEGTSGNSQTYPVTLSQGWHKFRIQTADFTGNCGPWSGKGLAVSYQVGSGAQTLFSEATLALSVCPDGYIQGGVTLASGATLSNGASENAAVVYDGVTATGTGATLDGAFKFCGGTLAFQNVDPATRDLPTVLAITNPADGYLADVGAIAIDFTAKPVRSKVTVCPAGGLTAETAAQKVSVTVNGEPVGRFGCLVEDGNLKLRLASGTIIIVR